MNENSEKTFVDGRELVIDVVANESDTSNIEFSQIYEPLQNEHISIRDLHVDPTLKPDHLLQPYSTWLLSSGEEKRRNSIQNFLQSQPSNDAISPLVKMNDHDWSSLEASVESGDVLIGQADKKSSVSNNHQMISEILGHQAGLRNERNHFLLSNLLISRFQQVNCEIEECMRSKRYRQKPAFQAPPTIAEVSSQSSQSSNHITLSGSSIKSKDKPNPNIAVNKYSSQADVIANVLIRDVESYLKAIGHYSIGERIFRINPLINQFTRNSSVDLTMAGQFEQNALTAGTTENDSINPAESVHSSINPDAVSSSPSELLIKAAVSAQFSPQTVPVGGRPQLAPDLSLPNYVASKSPPNTKKSEILERQRGRCPGCNTHFSPNKSSKSKLQRFCWYYGLLFCSSCHANTLMIIPARVLHRWDFSMLPVSRPARDLLHLIHTAPIFQFGLHFSPYIRDTHKALCEVTKLRLQASQLLVFIRVCRQAGILMRSVAKLPPHWITNSNQLWASIFSQFEEAQQSGSSATFPAPVSISRDKLMFSMSDLQLLESGRMEKELRQFVSSCIEHVSICPLCQARGFICELCLTAKPNTNSKTKTKAKKSKKSGDSRNDDDVLFPFEIDRVKQCEHCSSCVHRKCLQKLTETVSMASHMNDVPYSGASWWCRRCQRKQDRTAHDMDTVSLLLEAVDYKEYSDVHENDEDAVAGGNAI